MPDRPGDQRGRGAHLAYRNRRAVPAHAATGADQVRPDDGQRDRPADLPPADRPLRVEGGPGDEPLPFEAAVGDPLRGQLDPGTRNQLTAMKTIAQARKNAASKESQPFLPGLSAVTASR